MKKFLLFALMACAFIACENYEPKQSTKELNGKIIGTLGCYDEATKTTFYKGYFVETSDKDTVLSFNLDVKDSIEVRYGTYAITPILIPYPFSLTILEPSDPQYVRYTPPIEDTMHQPITINEIIQVIINPQKK